MSLRARLQRLVEDLLPWFDPAAERERRAYTLRLAARERASKANAEHVRAAYRRTADRLER